MVETNINARPRTAMTGKHKRRLRAEGIVPAIVYGKGMTNQLIEVEAKALQSAIQKKGRNALIDLVLRGQQGDKKMVVMLKEIQRDPIRRDIKHVDLYKISLKDKLHTAIPVVLKGEPRGLADGGVVQAGVREVEVECLPTEIPESIQVDIGFLEIGDHLSVVDLKEMPEYRILTEPETVLVSIIAPRKAEDADVSAAPAAGPAAGTQEDEGKDGKA